MPTEFGIQDRERVVHAGQPQADGSLRYDVELTVGRSDKGGPLRFRGPFAQGKPDDPFLYLSWRCREVVPAPWISRKKIRLGMITWEQIEAAAETGGVLEATVPGFGAGATQRLPEGWKLTPMDGEQ